MTPELAAAIIACLGAIAAWFKARTDIGSIKDDRAATKTERDKEAQELRDKVLKLEFLCASQKDTLIEQKSRIDDTVQQIAVLNRQLAEVLVKMDHVIDALKELKEARND